MDIDSRIVLSIIIPVYNVEQYLRECLDSVFTQDLTGSEVIIVNDGSTDGSPKIIEEYHRSYPLIVRVINKQNGGLSSARNVGIEHAYGEFLYFIDSDDYLESHAVTTIKEIINLNRGVDIFYSDCIVTSLGERRAELRESSIPVMSLTSFVLYMFQRGLNINPNAFSFVYSRSFLNKHKIRFTEGIKYEDTLFKYQLFDIERGIIKAIHLERAFYIYRVGREGSLSTSISIRNFKDKEFIRRTTNRIWSPNPNRGKEYYHMLYNDAIYMLYEAYLSGHIKQYRKFWGYSDLRIIHKGISSKREYGIWFLISLSPKWMARYYANDLPAWKRRMTNILLSCFMKIVSLS